MSGARVRYLFADGPGRTEGLRRNPLLLIAATRFFLGIVGDWAGRFKTETLDGALSFIVSWYGFIPLLAGGLL